MTPEERARFCASLFLDPAKVSSEKRARVEREIAVLIREAVMAEREACLRIIEHPNAGLEPPDGGAPTPDEMLANIAAAIRARTP